LDGGAHVGVLTEGVYEHCGELGGFRFRGAERDCFADHPGLVHQRPVTPI
jgi:hypothetical protein